MIDTPTLPHPVSKSNISEMILSQYKGGVGGEKGQ